MALTPYGLIPENMEERDGNDYVAGMLEGYLGYRSNIHVGGHVWEWNTMPSARKLIKRINWAYNLRKDWKRFSLVAIKLTVKDWIDVEMAPPKPLLDVALKIRDGHSTPLAPGYFYTYNSSEYYADYNDSPEAIHDWVFLYDKLYIHRKAWKMKSDKHARYLLASGGWNAV